MKIRTKYIDSEKLVEFVFVGKEGSSDILFHHPFTRLQDIHIYHLSAVPFFQKPGDGQLEGTPPSCIDVMQCSWGANAADMAVMQCILG